MDLIARKVSGEALSSAEITSLVQGYTAGAVADSQMAEFTHAVMNHGMTRAELRGMTRAMVASGKQLDFRHLSKPSVDKHSTGGVGDKITLILAPLVASFGAAVPQLAGRGLGHTGGTIDKLESIPGWRATLSSGEMLEALDAHGCFIAAASAEIAPADAKLYALRDVSGTVASLPLIASSIMSKKIAGGAQSLVLDVKCGSGAFLPSIEEARELARTLVELGSDAQIQTRALITDMQTPLGQTVGNALEIREALEVLNGGGPDDVRELTLALAREMLDLAGMVEADPAENLRNGRALATWRDMIFYQGGNPDAPLPTATQTHDVLATETGTMLSMDARQVADAAWHLGTGRAVMGERIDATAGLELFVKPGQSIRAGETVMRLHTSRPETMERALGVLDGAVRVGSSEEFVARESVVLERVTAI